MSFTIKYGDLFENVEHGHIVHGCNAQGAMGSGFAALIRDKYPLAYKKYIKQANTGYILGEVIPVVVEPNLEIIHAITQEFYGTDRVHVDYDAVRQAMKGTLHLATIGLIESTDVHMPLIGGGLAGGDPPKLISIMNEIFGEAEVDATLWMLDLLKINELQVVDS